MTHGLNGVYIYDTLDNPSMPTKFTAQTRNDRRMDA